MSTEQILVLRDNAKAQLMQIKSIDDGLSHLSKVKAIEVWAKAEKMDAEMQVIIKEQKLRTERILGELIKQGQETGEVLKQGVNIRFQDIPDRNIRPKSLSDIGLTPKQSSNFQAIASIPEHDFEDFIMDKKNQVDIAVKGLTTTAAVEFAKTINSASNVPNEEELRKRNKRLADINLRLERESEVKAIIRDINTNYTKKEREFIKERILS